VSPGEPYTGPPSGQPPYGQPPYGQPPYAQPLYGQAPYGPPGAYGYPQPWAGAPPRGPRRPGQVTGAAVLSFVQAGLVLFATLYLWLLVSMGRLESVAIHGPSNGGPLVAEGTVLAIVQLLSVAALIAAGALALSRRSRLAWVVVLVASAVQAALAGYWATRLPALIGTLDSGASDSGVAVFSVLFAAAPLVALGLVLFRPGRSWFDGTPRR
jgi:hypothetical protein